MDLDILKEIKQKNILHWNYRNFIAFPEELLEGQHILEIYLKWNHIKKLPKWLGQLRNLTNLYLCGNELNSLPNEIAELESLTYLDVGQNNLSSLPSAVGDLSQLNVLNASENNLTCLPESICSLTSLKVLLLSGNRLTYLPELICHCQDLEEICLDDNLLICLPFQIVYLPNLKFLSITHNQIVYLPALPFISSPQLRFQENPYLNYLAYSLGCHSSYNTKQAVDDFWALETFGCLQSNPENNTYQKVTLTSTKHIFNNGEHIILILPYGLRTLCQPSKKCRKVPSMYELAIREVYRSFYCHKLTIMSKNGNHVFSMSRERIQHSEVGSFPIDIYMQLCNGPTTICNNPHCNTAIFSYAIMYIVQKNIVTRFGNVSEIYATIFFCSESCSMKCHAYDDLLLSPIEWQQIIHE